MYRLLPALALVSSLFFFPAAQTAHAQELLATNALAGTALFTVTPFVAPAPVAESETVPAPLATAVAATVARNAETAQGPTFINASLAPRRPERPMILPALYASQIALQALDAHSTYKAIGRGAHEANPLMKGVVDNRGAMFAVKAGVAASTIWAAEHLWKRGNKVGAIATMVVANAVAAAVVAHNYRLASELR
ncbi:MAG TPA: DUF5658 family protein [Vicinamibacterales bacterium]